MLGLWGGGGGGGGTEMRVSGTRYRWSLQTRLCGPDVHVQACACVHFLLSNGLG